MLNCDENKLSPKGNVWFLYLLEYKTLWKHRICLTLEATKGATYFGLAINLFISKFPSVTDMR